MSTPRISLLHSKFAYIIIYSTFPFGCLIDILNYPVQNGFLKKKKIHLYLQSFSSLWQSHPSGCSCLKLFTFPLFLFFPHNMPSEKSCWLYFQNISKIHLFSVFLLLPSWYELAESPGCVTVLAPKRSHCFYSCPTLQSNFTTADRMII